MWMCVYKSVFDQRGAQIARPRRTYISPIAINNEWKNEKSCCYYAKLYSLSPCIDFSYEFHAALSFILVFMYIYIFDAVYA